MEQCENPLKRPNYDVRMYVILKSGGEEVKNMQDKYQDVTDKKAVTQSYRECNYCGRKYRFVKEQCPAWGNKCTKCGRMNHFRVKCSSLSSYFSRKGKKKNIYRVNVQSQDEDSDSDFERIMMVNGTQGEKNPASRLIC